MAFASIERLRGFFVGCLAIQFRSHRAHSFSATEQGYYHPDTKTKIASSAAKAERRGVERSRVRRETCERCGRPPPLCVCESLPETPIRTSTSVLILQHPRERRRKSLSTVPLVPLVLEKCTVKVGYSFTGRELDLVAKCLAAGQKPLLLFPGRDAISLDDDIGADTLNGLQDTEQLLILIDGTWAEAKRMMLQSPELVESCEQVQFRSEHESIYPSSLRKEPEKHCLSTLESVARALMTLEPSAERARRSKMFLEGSMRCMVERRISVSETRNRAPRFARKEMRISNKNKRIHEIKKQLFI